MNHRHDIDNRDPNMPSNVRLALALSGLAFFGIVAFRYWWAGREGRLPEGHPWVPLMLVLVGISQFAMATPKTRLQFTYVTGVVLLVTTVGVLIGVAVNIPNIIASIKGTIRTLF